jgi:CRISPR/Cas system CSM-associated protein Csm3 (group 7 of RAMP superfamily)
MTNNINTHRYLARVILEAATPLAVASGQRNVLSDKLVLLDVNGLPYIPGTSLCGVLRHNLGLKPMELNGLFGFQEKNDGEGSRLVITAAHMLGDDGTVLDGIRDIDFSSEYFKNFKALPVRQHVRISHRGTAEDGGKFDEQLVFKGCRFCFEIELVTNDNLEDQKAWAKILNAFKNPAFRIGSGTRKGFGEMKLVSLQETTLNLEKELEKYLEKTSALDGEAWWDGISIKDNYHSTDEWIEYLLTLRPQDFFLFGSGLESEDADISFVTETFLTWDSNNKPSWKESRALIPASSLKGALAHRVAYHYNRIKGVTIEKVESADSLQELLQNGYKLPPATKKFEGSNVNDRLEMITRFNPAVVELFGIAEGDFIKRGNVIFSDFYFEGEPDKKLLNHVAIDRFTGGAMEGALFSEEVVYGKELQAELRILVNKEIIKKTEIIDAFKSALKDLCSGALPLGGGTMRGHGCFEGKLLKNGKEI